MATASSIDLQADGVVCDARNREGARHGAAGDHDHVVVELPRLTDLGRDRRDLRRVVDARDLRGDDAGLLEVTTLRDDRVTRFDRPCGHLGEERLVRHVRERVDDRDLGLARSQPLLELPRSVEPGIAATDDENLGHGETDSSFCLNVRSLLANTDSPPEMPSGADAQQRSYRTKSSDQRERDRDICERPRGREQRGRRIVIGKGRVGDRYDLLFLGRVGRRLTRRSPVQGDPLGQAAEWVLLYGLDVGVQRRDRVDESESVECAPVLSLRQSG